jgi:hypothetical protein
VRGRARGGAHRGQDTACSKEREREFERELEGVGERERESGRVGELESWRVVISLELSRTLQELEEYTSEIDSRNLMQWQGDP